ncbi:MAG: phage holin family protein [Fimbriimonadaceae bacterium]|nr:phage holin family protein [Fimbriimonadaceae bacterium]QYK56115.1 MAG: phage holin family protein [Fimbriimonadaceae bacterium]
MRKMFLRWVLLAVSLVAASWLTGLVLPGQFVVRLENAGDVLMIFIGVAVLSFVNATIGSLVKLLTLPLNCLTLGLFSLVVNAAMLMIVGNLGLGFRVEGFLAALLGSVLLSAVSAVLGAFVKEDD